MKDEPIIGGKPFQVRKGLVRIVSLRNELVDEVSDPDLVVQELRQGGYPVDLFTFLQKPPDTLRRFSYHMEWDNLAGLQISTYQNWIEKQIHPNTRTNIRKAAKRGLVVRVDSFNDELAAGLVKLFNETPVRRGKPYPYYGWDLAMVKRTWGTQLDQSFWVVAYYQDLLVGFIKLIMSGGLARTSGTVASEAHRDKAPMNAILAKCVELCASKEIPLLVYGQFTYGKKGEDSLTAFKRNCGFQRIEVPRYYIPLSKRGCVALRLGLHNGLREVLPGPVQRALLRLRSQMLTAYLRAFSK